MSFYWQTSNCESEAPCALSVFFLRKYACGWEDVEVLQPRRALLLHQSAQRACNLWCFRWRLWFTLQQYRAACTCCLIPSTLNESLISNAWDLLQHGLTIVISADAAGYGTVGRLQRWRDGEREREVGWLNEKWKMSSHNTRSQTTERKKERGEGGGGKKKVRV